MAKRGRKSKYSSKKHPQLAYDFCSDHGFTDKELAKLFDIHVSNLYEWIKKHPELQAEIQRGKDDYDSSEIEKSLRRRANGYSYKEKTYEAIKITDFETGETTTVLDEDGNPKLVCTKIVKKSMAPDTTAIIYWLCNRQKERWKHVNRVEVSGPGGGGIPMGDNISDEERKALKEVAKAWAERERRRQQRQ